MAVLVMAWLAAWAAMATAPDTPIGRALFVGLVAAPARVANRITRGQVAIAVLLLAIVALLAWAEMDDALAVMRMASPELLSWVALVDASSLVDIVAATLVTATAVRWRAVAMRVGALARRPAPRVRARRTAKRDRPANDDGEDAPALAA